MTAIRKAALLAFADTVNRNAARWARENTFPSELRESDMKIDFYHERRAKTHPENPHRPKPKRKKKK